MSGIDSKYFFWGSAFPDQYALYSFDLNRILMVSSSDLHLDCVVSCMRSKIHLDIVPLTQAINFHPDLLDNSCCHNWSIVGWRLKNTSTDINFIDLPENNDSSGAFIQLIEHQNNEISDLQKFCWLCYYCYHYFMDLGNPIRKNVVNLQTTICPVHIRRFNSLVNQCIDILAKEQSYHVAEQHIESILQDEIFCD